jgi:hypothetical protein
LYLPAVLIGGGGIKRLLFHKVQENDIFLYPSIFEIVHGKLKVSVHQPGYKPAFTVHPYARVCMSMEDLENCAKLVAQAVIENFAAC